MSVERYILLVVLGDARSTGAMQPTYIDLILGVLLSISLAIRSIPNESHMPRTCQTAGKLCAYLSMYRMKDGDPG